MEAVDHRPDAKYFGIKDGMRHFPEALAKSITDCDGKKAEIVTRAAVRGITQGLEGNKVRVSWIDTPVGTGAEPASTHPGSGNGVVFPAASLPTEEHHREFDKVIVTCTPPAMRRLQFNPPLPSDKQRALREINFNASTKVFLQFSERFWVADGTPNGSSVTDTAIRAVYYPTSSTSKVVIASYTWAMAARGWDSLTPEERVQYALDDLVELHGEKIRSLFVAGQSWSWLRDNFIMGEAAMIFPEQLPLQAALARPFQNVYFAGDTLSFKVAWIEGAIESGMRAALELTGLPPIPGTLVLDCTLRDGGYLNEWDFTLEQAKTLASKSAEAGFQIIEIGYRNHHDGLSGTCDNDYIRELRAVVPTTSQIAVMFAPEDIKESDLAEMKEAGVDVVRATLHSSAESFEKGLALLRYAKSVKLKTSANITWASEYPMDELLSRAQQALDCDVDFLYFADSLAAMNPGVVARLFRTVKTKLILKATRLGFHNHNMLGLAVSNALAALDAGAVIVDGTYRGMGRSAGNVPLEQFIPTLKRTGRPSAVDELKTLRIAAYLEKEIPESGPRPTVLDTAYAVYNFSQLNERPFFTSAAQQFGVEELDLMAYMNQNQDLDRVHLTQEVVNQAAAELKEKQAGGVEIAL